jgi:hypothetical protein
MLEADDVAMELAALAAAAEEAVCTVVADISEAV